MTFDDYNAPMPTTRCGECPVGSPARHYLLTDGSQRWLCRGCARHRHIMGMIAGKCPELYDKPTPDGQGSRRGPIDANARLFASVGPDSRFVGVQFDRSLSEDARAIVEAEVAKWAFPTAIPSIDSCAYHTPYGPIPLTPDGKGGYHGSMQLPCGVMPDVDADPPLESRRDDPLPSDPSWRDRDPLL